MSNRQSPPLTAKLNTEREKLIGIEADEAAAIAHQEQVAYQLSLGDGGTGQVVSMKDFGAAKKDLEAKRDAALIQRAVVRECERRLAEAQGIDAVLDASEAWASQWKASAGAAKANEAANRTLHEDRDAHAALAKAYAGLIETCPDFKQLFPNESRHNVVERFFDMVLRRQQLVALQWHPHWAPSRGGPHAAELPKLNEKISRAVRYIAEHPAEPARKPAA